LTAIEDSVNCLILSMLDSGRPRAGTRGRFAAVIASLLAVVLTFVFVLRSTGDAELLRLPAEQGPSGTSVERGDFDSLPFGKLSEETLGEEASEKSESESEDLEVAALITVDFDGLALVARFVGKWERSSPNRVRAMLGVIGARGPPVA
jgi:hypothetical protein